MEEISKRDNRVIIHYNPKNMGLMNSLNIGISLVKGEYIARMDADDISVLTRLEIELEYMKKNNLDMVSSNRIYIDEMGKKLSKGRPIIRDPQKALPYSNFIVHSSVMVKTSVLKALNGYRNFYNSEDYDMWLRILSSDYRIGIINQYLIYYRIRNNSMSWKNKLEQYYISVYQQKMYRERLKTGEDSFSEENLQKYIKSKHISEGKNKRYMFTRKMLDKAIIDYKKKNWHFISYFMLAFLGYPSVVCANVKSVLCMK